MNKQSRNSKWCLNCGRWVFLCYCRTTLPYWAPASVEMWIEEKSSCPNGQLFKATASK
jgi:hypothetical protein